MTVERRCSSALLPKLAHSSERPGPYRVRTAVHRRDAGLRSRI